MNSAVEATGSRGTWGYPPRRPYNLLAWYFTVGCLQLVLTVVRQPLPDTNIQLNLWLAIVSGVQILLCLWAGARLARWALPYLVASGVVVVAISAWGAAGGQGQLVGGFYLLVLGMFGGYFLGWTELRIVVALAVLLYGAALLLNYRLDSAGYLLAALVVLMAVSFIVFSLVQHLRDEATHDPLTGALNRRGLQDSAGVLHALDERRHVETTVVEIDLNGFKAYNDAHGHQAGDALLADVVRDWSSVLRRTDLLSRSGGDEFVLVLPATTREEAEVLVARMRAANPTQWAAGLTTWRPGQPLPEALGVADSVMYEQKPNRRTSPPG